jgi:hypothetical protein
LSLLGFAFITIELDLIPRFMLIVGYPLYAVATVLSVVLAGAALGSMTSGAIVGARSQRWPLAFARLAVTGLAVTAALPAVGRVALSAPMPVRVLVSVAAIAPLAYFMGMPFPLGILELGTKPRGAVAWAWSLNGLCTTIGAVLSALLSLWIGLQATELVALSAYAAAADMFALLRRSNRLAVRDGGNPLVTAA